jgi:hypothetical protein
MNQTKLKIIARLTADYIASYFGYIFVVYVVCIFLATTVPSTRAFFYWPAFHVTVFIFGIITITSPRFIALLGRPQFILESLRYWYLGFGSQPKLKLFMLVLTPVLLIIFQVSIPMLLFGFVCAFILLRTSKVVYPLALSLACFLVGRLLSTSGQAQAVAWSEFGYYFFILSALVNMRPFQSNVTPFQWLFKRLGKRGKVGEKTFDKPQSLGI